MLRDPFGMAALKAAREGVCPVWELDEFYTNHDAFDVLCAQFTCARCVATPEDMGLDGWEPLPTLDGDLEIPF